MSSVVAPTTQSPPQSVKIVVSRKKGSTNKNDTTYRSDAVEMRILNPSVKRNGSNMSPHQTANPSLLVAVRDIEPGEKIFAEKAFLTFDTSVSEKEQIQSIRAQMSKITRNMSSALSLFFSLPCLNDKESKSESKDLVLIDRHAIEYNVNNKGVFVSVSKCRHSCAPNVEISILKDGVAIAHATKFIEKGTEITRNTLGELNMPFEQRNDKFRHKYLTRCTCCVCAACISDRDFCKNDDILRTKIAQAENEFYVTMKDLPHEAVSIAHRLIGILIQSALNEKHFQYTDIPMMRRLHLRVANLCMKNLDGSQLSVDHLKFAAAYCAVGLGWTNPETLKILSYLEKRSISTISLSELPIFNKTINKELFKDFLNESILTHEKKFYDGTYSKDSRSNSPSTNTYDRIPDQHLKVTMPKNVSLPNIVSTSSLGALPPERHNSQDAKVSPGRDFIPIASSVEFARKVDQSTTVSAELRQQEAIINEMDESGSVGTSSASLGSITKKVSLRIPQVNIGHTLVPPSHHSTDIKNHDMRDYHRYHLRVSQNKKGGKKEALSTVNIYLDGDDDHSLGSSGSNSLGSCGSTRRNGLYKGRSHIQALSLSPNRRERQQSLSDDDDDISVLTPNAQDDDYQLQFNPYDTTANSNLSAFSIWASKNKSNAARKRNDRKSMFKKATDEEKSPDMSTSELLHIKKSTLQVTSPKDVHKTGSPPGPLGPLIVDIPLSTKFSINDVTDKDDLSSRPVSSGAVDLSSRPNTGIGMGSSTIKKALV